MATVTLTRDNLKEVIGQNDIIIIDFWAAWCGPCQSFGPIFEAASERYENIVFAKVNTEEEVELAGAFQVRSIPTLVIFREGIIVYAQPGALPESALVEIVEKTLALDMDKVRLEVEAQKIAEKSGE